MTNHNRDTKITTDNAYELAVRLTISALNKSARFSGCEVFLKEAEIITLFWNAPQTFTTIPDCFSYVHDTYIDLIAYEGHYLEDVVRTGKKKDITVRDHVLNQIKYRFGKESPKYQLLEILEGFDYKEPEKEDDPGYEVALKKLQAEFELTDAEITLIGLVGSGHSKKEVMQIMQIGRTTYTNRITRIRKKCGAK